MATVELQRSRDQLGHTTRTEYSAAGTGTKVTDVLGKITDWHLRRSRQSSDDARRAWTN